MALSAHKLPDSIYHVYIHIYIIGIYNIFKHFIYTFLTLFFKQGLFKIFQLIKKKYRYIFSPIEEYRVKRIVIRTYVICLFMTGQYILYMYT